MTKEVSYVENNGEYLIMKDDGSTELLKNKKEFDKYVKDNE